MIEPQLSEPSGAWQPRNVRGARTKDALIVDDHPVVREAIKGLIEKSFPDILVTECDGHTSVVNRICGANWAIVILDMNLPGANGLDILKAVKSAGNKVPIVVFSLYAKEQYAARALRAGAQAYVPKDRPSSDLIDAISTVLAGGGEVPSYPRSSRPVRP
jgi:two-component system, NarL family, invasion response regulator UvrY